MLSFSLSPPFLSYHPMFLTLNSRHKCGHNSCQQQLETIRLCVERKIENSEVETPFRVLPAPLEVESCSLKAAAAAAAAAVLI